MQPELAIGAITEDGKIYLNSYGSGMQGLTDGYLASEREHQLREISRRKKLFRDVLPAASISGRSIIVTDDGIATGSTMIAALQSLISANPQEVIVAVPVAPVDRLQEIGEWCNEVVCLRQEEDFWAVGQFYREFQPVEDDEVVKILKGFARKTGPAQREEVKVG